MRILFIRHGESNYTDDCLTETGIIQAKACAKRLCREGITEIYASPSGRARETAAHTAALLNLPVTILDFMGGIAWGGPGIPCDGRPWVLGEQMLAEGFDFLHEDWRQHPYFKNNAATACYEAIAPQFDAFLNAQGYRHEGRRFYCHTGADSTIALFSHGGSGACALAHLLNLPFPYVCSVLRHDLTSIITLFFPSVENAYIFPRLDLFNDCAHIHRDKTAGSFSDS